MKNATKKITEFALAKSKFLFLFAVIFGTLTAIPLQAQQSPVTQRRLDSEERTNVNVFKQSSPSVVNICTKQALRARRGNVILELGRIPKGSGSGFIWDDTGHVVTNFHVIEGADSVQVTLADGTEWEATVVSSAPEFDIAVLRVEAPREKIRPLAIGRSDDLEVGQKVFAIGNPFGLDQTLTAGIVSGLGRQIESENGQTIRGVIQTDAAINPGNSGGPLLDNEGRLIGMNTAILSRSGGSSGVGFAVPVNTIRTSVTRQIAGRSAGRGFLGIALAPRQVSAQASDEGFAILQVFDNSPAKESGLRAAEISENGVTWGDILMSIDGQQVTDPEAAIEILQSRQSGDEVMLGIKRGEDFMRVNVRLARLPETVR